MRARALAPIIALLAQVSAAEAQRAPGDPDPIALRAALAERIERTRIGLEAESARAAGLAAALEQLQPNAAARALRNAQRANPALTTLVPPTLTISPSPEVVGGAAARLRTISGELARDAERLQGVGQTAADRPLATTLGALSRVELSDSARRIIEPTSAGFPAIVGYGGDAGEAAPAALGGATPFIVGRGAWTADMPSVAALVYQDAQGRLKIECSATLVAPNAVLTARHCVDGTITSGDPTGVFFQHAGLVPLANVDPVLSHSGQAFPRDDLAIVFLDRAVIEITPATLNDSGRLPVGSEAVAVGFGFRSGAVVAGLGAATPLVRETGAKLRGRVRSAACPTDAGGANLTGAPLICWISTWNAFHDETGSTCNGDSGGPLFATLGGRVVLAGVTSGGIGGCAPQTIAWDTEIFDYVTWIRQRLAARPAPVALAWSNPLDPLSNPGRFIRPHSTDQTLLDEDGILDSIPFVLDPGHGLLRVSVNGSGDPERPNRRPLARLDLLGPGGAVCTQDTASVLLVCDVRDPAAGPWTFRLAGRPGAEVQISVLTFRR